MSVDPVLVCPAVFPLKSLAEYQFHVVFQRLFHTLSSHLWLCINISLNSVLHHLNIFLLSHAFPLRCIKYKPLLWGEYLFTRLNQKSRSEEACSKFLPETRSVLPLWNKKYFSVSFPFAITSRFLTACAASQCHVRFTAFLGFVTWDHSRSQAPLLLDYHKKGILQAITEVVPLLAVFEYWSWNFAFLPCCFFFFPFFGGAQMWPPVVEKKTVCRGLAFRRDTDTTFDHYHSGWFSRWRDEWAYYHDIDPEASGLSLPTP